MPDFQVDTAQLHEASGRLDAVARALNPDYAKVDPSALGFPSAMFAAANFDTAWAAGATLVGRAVTVVSQHLGKASVNYETAERNNTCPAPPQ